MTPDAPGREPADAAETLLAECLRLRDGGQEADVDTLCSANPDLAARVRSLLEFHDRAVHSLEACGAQGPQVAPPPGLVARLQRQFQRKQPALLPGERIGLYRIVSPLGEGGFATVYLAEQQAPVRRRVAVKILKPGLESDEVVARFEAERQALAIMSHPSIATVFDAGTMSSGQPYFVMEHVPGVAITEYCDAHRLNIRQRLELFLRVCDAVQHAHHKAVIHRDLKPSNVLVTGEGDRALPKVIDFGIAKAIDHRLTEKTLVTEVGQMIGTPAYMSPEQAGGSVLDIDTRTDIYALGVLLYELLVGALPFAPEALQRAGFLGARRIILEEEPPKPSTRLAGLGEAATLEAERRSSEVRSLSRQLRGDLDRIAMKAMAKDRARRYGTAAEMAQDIRRHLNHEPILATSPGLVYRLRKAVRRHRAAFAAAAVAALALAVAGVWAAYESHARYRQRLERSLELCDEARRLGRTFLANRRRTLDHLVRWKEETKKPPPWRPVWERSQEFELYDQYTAALQEVENGYSDVVRSFQLAFEMAPPGSAPLEVAKRAFAAFYFDVLKSGLREVPVTLGERFFASEVLRLDPSIFTYRFGKVLLASDPPGAAVYCFRYEESPHDRRLVPLPFDPSPRGGDRGNVVGREFLRVEEVLEPWPAAVPFEPEDVVVSAAGRRVATRGDLARALAGLSPDEAVELTLLRKGRQFTVEWVPFPAGVYSDIPSDCPLQPGRLISIREQLGVSFEGYPLEISEKCRLGLTSPSGPLQVELPAGSYLLLFCRDGYASARYSLVVPAGEATVQVRLLRPQDIPPDCVYIPAGSGTFGGDPEAFEPLEHSSTKGGGFFVKRHEVTHREYLEFLEARGVERDGTALPASPVVAKVTGGKPVLLVPKRDGQRELFYELDATGHWVIRESYAQHLRPEGPVLGISQLAAWEYAHWCSSRDPRCRYRLPSDREWEKAARGADRRLHVWGNYLVWSHCWCKNGVYPGPSRLPPAVGIRPADESVYGVRDLAGSVSEWTTDRKSDDPRSPYHAFFSVRGGNWLNVEAFYLHAATRDGRLPQGSGESIGIRLVVDLPGENE